MEISRIRMLMQGLHALESGNVKPREVIKHGWAHAISEARQKRIGRSAEQIVEDHNVYRQRKLNEESEKDIQEQGILVVGLLQSVTSE